jgi:GNAT superfamily N-acetyltransferase
MHVSLATTDPDLQKISPVLLQLRPQYTEARLVARIKLQQQSGFQIAYVSEDSDFLCVARFLIGHKLAWQKYLYVDDLVTAESRRSTGAGKCMLDWLKQHTRELGCQQLHLDSGVQRFGAHKFYLREGFSINSHHFAFTNLDADQS